MMGPKRKSRNVRNNTRKKRAIHFWSVMILFLFLSLYCYGYVILYYLRGPKTIYIVAQSGPGRLGNQLFQYGSVLGIYEERRRNNPYQDNIRFCVSRYHPFSAIEPTYFVGPFPLCPPHMPEPRHLDEKGYAVHTTFDETQYCSSNQCSFTFGPYLQSFKYLKPATEALHSHLNWTSNIRSTAQAIIDQIRPDPTTTVVGIHVRRRDVLQVDYLHAAPIEHFQKAMDYFSLKFDGNVVFLIASDDIEWCKAQQEFDKALMLKNMDAILDMAILSLTDHHILSVGSFGWWGAWLSKPGEVIYYNDAINLNHPTNRGQFTSEDYYPDTWTPM